jgi:hypothetical protein
VLDKRPTDDARAVVVTFSHPIVDGTRSVALVGDFNDWSADAHPMTLAPASCSCEVSLVAGRTYRFRYLVDGERWENDWQADDYQANDFGADDSIIDLTSPLGVEASPSATPATKKKAPAKKPAAKKAAAPKKAAATKKAPAKPRKQVPPAE